MELARHSRAAPNEVCDWTAQRVAVWLDDVGDDIADEYADRFIEHGVSGKTLLYGLEKSFDVLGVDRKLHKERIIRCRDKLLCVDDHLNDVSQRVELEPPDTEEHERPRGPLSVLSD